MSLSERRLKNELENTRKLNQWSSLIKVVPVDETDEAPTEYDVFFGVKSVIDAAGNTRNKHHAKIYLSAEYPRVPPTVRVAMPIYHPNIASDMQNTRFLNEMLVELDRIHDQDEYEAYLRKLRNNPDYQWARVCLDILELNWAVELTLMDVIIQLGEMLQYKLLADNHSLNDEAAQWAKQHASELPIDKRHLLDKLPRGEQPAIEETPEIEVDLLED